MTDDLMPGMGGTELADALHAIKPDAPVLVISGYAESHGINPALLRLAKPLRKDELAESLSQRRG
nr:hypothetical protein [Sphingomonas glacialis]